MADFCRKCAKELNFPKADLGIKELLIDPGYEMTVLCEGCGTIIIQNIDGKEVVFRPDTNEYKLESDNEPRITESKETSTHF